MNLLTYSAGVLALGVH
jgi:hypothetical protein